MADDKLVSRLLLIGLAVVILAILITQYTSSKTATTTPTPTTTQQPIRREYFSQPTMQEQGNFQSFAETQPAPVSTSQSKQAMNQVMPSEAMSNELYKAVDFTTENKIPMDCAPRDKNTVADLLPKDAANSKWAQANPAGQGSVIDKNFINAGYLVGINTVGQSLKNANYQLRSDPPIEKVNVGPWQQSTIEYDVSRRFFEIGEC